MVLLLHTVLISVVIRKLKHDIIPIKANRFQIIMFEDNGIGAVVLVVIVSDSGVQQQNVQYQRLEKWRKGK